MIEQVLQPRNLERALQQVISNKGSAGIDGMKVSELTDYMRNNKARLMQEIKEDKYLPAFIRGKEIRKGGGKTRLLGIPTAVDRMLQQAVSQSIMYQFEKEFVETSYGFRPNKNARQAVAKAWENIHDGKCHIVNIDLKNFFDEVDHCLLLNLIYRKIKCPIVMRLIRKWLKVPIDIEGKLTKRRKEIPQGSPLSPLLSNILLHELDKELMKGGHSFVRYADDFSIYVKSKSEAKEVGNAIYLFLKNKLHLPINREKSGLRKPVQFSILGFRFVPTYRKGDKNKYQLTVSDKAWTSFKQKLKEITRKTKPIKLLERISKIKEIQ